MIEIWSALIAALAPTLAVAVAWRHHAATMQRHGVKLHEIHKMTNSRLTKALSTIRRLEDEVRALREIVKPCP